jgi:hypothetical protein
VLKGAQGLSMYSMTQMCRVRPYNKIFQKQK